MDQKDNAFALLVGRAALKLWPDLPRAVQEQLFEECAASDDLARYGLAVYLHDRHPRTAHPAKPAATA